MSDLDYGPGDEELFPAEDLERLWKASNGGDVAVRIKGDQLNSILKVDRFNKNAWYVVTKKSVRRI